MAQFTVRNLEADVKTRLKRRARRHDTSFENEVRQILRNAAKDEGSPEVELGSRIASRFARTGLTEDLPELHGSVRPADFR